MRIFALLLCLFPVAVTAWAQDRLADAQVLTDERRYLAANALLDEFIQAHPERKYDLSRAYLLKSYNYLQLENFPAAQSANEQSLRLRYALRSPEAIENFIRFGQIALRRGRPELALDYLDEAATMYFEEPRHYGLIQSYRAQAHLALGQLEEAETAFRTAYDVFRIEVGEEDPALVDLYDYWARLALPRGDTAAARQRWETAAALGSRLTPLPEHSFHALEALGQLAENTDVQRAEQYFQRALTLATQSLDSHRQWRSELALAEHYRRTGRWREAQSLTDSLAGRLLSSAGEGGLVVDPRLAIAVFQRIDDRWAGSDSEDTLRLAHRLALAAADWLTSFSPAWSSGPEEGAITDQMEMVVERGLAATARLQARDRRNVEPAATAMILMDALQHGHWLRQRYALQRDTSLTQQLRSAARQLAFTPDDPSALEVWRQAERRYSHETRVTAGSLEDLDAFLGNDGTLLSYVVGKRALYLLGLAKGGKSITFTERSFASGSASELSDYISNFEQSLLNDQAEEARTYGHWLYQQLIDPLDEQLKEADHLVILPHGPLHRLPFEALISHWDREKRGQPPAFTQFHYLLEKATISYAPSVSDWLTVPQSLLADGAFLGLAGGDPGLQARSVEAPATAAREVTTLSQQLRQRGYGTFNLLYSTATPYELRQQLTLGNYRLLHLATADELSLSDIYELPLREQLVSLSAPTSTPGLPLAYGHAFLRAGAAGLLLARWPHPSTHQLTFLTTYYDQLLGGQPPREALRQAALGLLRQAETAAPKQWAGWMWVGK